MNTPEALILGRAIFATTQGLTAHGNGVLSNVKSRVSIFEFEDGRQHGGVIHHVPTNNPALFVRRIADQAGREVNLIGLVAPCKDHLDRKGFFGACVAVPIDRTSPEAAFCDWFVLIDPLWELYERTLTLYDIGSKRLNWKNLIHPSGKDRAYDWEKVHGNSVVLFDNLQNESNNEEDASEIMQRLQALTFLHSHTTTTIIVSTVELPGSKLLRGNVSDKALRTFSEARERSVLLPKPDARPASARSATIEDEIENLWDEVTRLHDEVQRLKAHLGGDGYGDIRRARFDQALWNSPFVDEQEKGVYLKWVKLALIGTAAFLVLILAATLIFWMIKGEISSDGLHELGHGIQNVGSYVSLT